jgi:hypothetical protein
MAGVPFVLVYGALVPAPCDTSRLELGFLFFY